MSWRLAFLFPLSISSPQEIEVEQLSDASSAGAEVQQADGGVERLPDSRADQIARNPQSSAADPQMSQLAERSDSTAQDNSISSTQSGRTARTEVPSGEDRCDREAKGERPKVCAAVIETRAAEFRQRKPIELSPEEKLIVERSPLLRDRSPLEAVRSADVLRSSDEDSQVLASLVLAPPAAPTPQAPEESELGAGTQALIDAIVQSLAGPGVILQ